MKKSGVTEELIDYLLGLKSAEDIIADLAQAIEKAVPVTGLTIKNGNVKMGTHHQAVHGGGDMPSIKVAILGFGTVGEGIYRILNERKEEIKNGKQDIQSISFPSLSEIRRKSV